MPSIGHESPLDHLGGMKAQGLGAFQGFLVEFPTEIRMKVNNKNTIPPGDSIPDLFQQQFLNSRELPRSLGSSK